MAAPIRAQGEQTQRAAWNEAAGLTAREATIVRLVAAGLPGEAVKVGAAEHELS